MPRLLIPTRNRPSSLLSVIRFLEEFYPETEVIIADGSIEKFANENQNNMRSPDRLLNIELQRFDYDLPFFDRLLAVLESVPDEFLIMGSDDDYPIMDELTRLSKSLEGDNEAVTALGATFHLKLISNEEITARLGLSRPIKGDDPLARGRNFAKWSFSTTYAVSRRSLLIERYRRAREVFLPKFYDFGVGVQDVFTGKMHASPRLTFIATRNFNHSYLRTEDPFLFVRRSDDFFKLLNFIQDDIRNYTSVDENEAKHIANKLMLNQVAFTAGASAPKFDGFEKSKIFNNRIVQSQIKLFNEIFCDHELHASEYADRLKFILAALQNVANSADNAGEPTTVDSLEQQQKLANFAESHTGRTNMFKSKSLNGKNPQKRTPLLPGTISLCVDDLL